MFDKKVSSMFEKVYSKSKVVMRNEFLSMFEIFEIPKLAMLSRTIYYIIDCNKHNSWIKYDNKNTSLHFHLIM